ncbi:MAG: riboflavin biosynthesis protein RibD [Hyphomicrobiales bacterium]|nr:MAG: riboflavin biosynthesis protein RibD [Hyphomicrobiales bacterium]
MSNSSGISWEVDQRFMAAAVRLGDKNKGRTGSNPSVGCIIVNTEHPFPVVAGRGVTAPGGRPHAEVLALAEAGPDARGATAYVTLEPCSHTGKTGPCAEALIEAGISRVVVAIKDPDIRVSGQGIAQLENAGILVETGIGIKHSQLSMAGYLKRTQYGRPWLTLKLAISQDGYIGRSGAGNTPITGENVRHIVHALRSHQDVIMIGAGTALLDDPMLDVRLPGLEKYSPARTVLDGSGGLSKYSRLAQSSATIQTSVIVRESNCQRAIDQLRSTDIDVTSCKINTTGQLDLHSVLASFAADGINNVLCEGGARISEALLRLDLVDELVIFRSSNNIGKGGLAAMPDEIAEYWKKQVRFSLENVEQFGADTMFVYLRNQLCLPE